MKAGSLKYRITIQRFTKSELPSGEEAKGWADFVTVYSAVSFGTGRERREAAQEIASAPATFSVRRTPATVTVTPADRIIFEGGEWDITSAVPSKQFRVGIDITATRKTA